MINSATALSDTRNIESRLVNALGLLGDKTRFKIFKILMTRSNICVGEIAEKVGVTPSATSQHFRSFELAGMVEKCRTGQKICYSLNVNEPIVKDLVLFVKKFNI